jgi:hypothetical protein
MFPAAITPFSGSFQFSLKSLGDGPGVQGVRV